VKSTNDNKPPFGNNVPKRKHLRRLETIFEHWRAPLFFVTVCVHRRRPVLCDPVIHQILVCGWRTIAEIYKWQVGCYMIMPDHVHFFVIPASREARQLSSFIRAWKYRTGKEIHQAGLAGFSWQKEFFDHLLRSSESYGDRWLYVRANPVRAGLAARPEDWPYQGEIHPLQW